MLFSNHTVTHSISRQHNPPMLEGIRNDVVMRQQRTLAAASGTRRADDKGDVFRGTNIDLRRSGIVVTHQSGIWRTAATLATDREDLLHKHTHTIPGKSPTRSVLLLKINATLKQILCFNIINLFKLIF